MQRSTFVALVLFLLRFNTSAQEMRTDETYFPLFKGSEWCYRDSGSVWPTDSAYCDTVTFTANRTVTRAGSEYFVFDGRFPKGIGPRNNDMPESTLIRLDYRGNIVVLEEGVNMLEQDLFLFDTDYPWGEDYAAHVFRRDSSLEFPIGTCKDCVTIERKIEEVQGEPFDYWTFCRGIGLVNHRWHVAYTYFGEEMLIRYHIPEKRSESK
jgi:hypothetical protein